MTRRDFEAQIGPAGALMIGDPEEVAAKILRHSDALGGVSRVTFQMNAASLAQEKMTQAIELVGTRVAPALRAKLGEVQR
jgi:alkanesulfonate monooxygenase SsuD/methylene tetrahydromethanopterin reductase-like flavin-dependent oxidoreductase (luciferase family)